MPYVEILAPRAAAAEKRQLTQAVTDGIVRGFDVAPSTVTIYFVPVGSDDYAHAGEFGLPPSGARVFVKLHAYRRSADQRRAVAEAMTPAIAACFDTPAHNIAIYFIDRERDEVAHEGHLASDETIETSTAP
jgi:phenylpyruvate tautomerase PptA (4-oxalocrotonate tautomerase family)